MGRVHEMQPNKIMSPVVPFGENAVDVAMVPKNLQNEAYFLPIMFAARVDSDEPR